ncbi:Uridine kinase [Nosema granulosis]|uniref:Uridine kinase n=1 Tax=Nosema granulosis TaxID=83296 RepID=A0A9P6L0K0_9MICR|nr:Uridine kinase [Nosema granulosis]
MSKNLESVIRDKLGEIFDMDNLYIICLQGTSGSGKTTYANYLRDVLAKKKIDVYLIHIDSYFAFESGSLEDDPNFDFDNPGTIRWDILDTTLSDIINKKRTILVHNRSGDINEEKIANPGFKVLIIEGLYSFNCLGKKKFNIAEFDPKNSDKKIATEYIENDNYKILSSNKSPYKDIKIINIRFLTCFTRLTSVRVQRDMIQLKLSFNEIYSRICNWIWPSTVRWVFSNEFDCDIEIQHGNFNSGAIENLSDALFKFFKVGGEREKMKIALDLNAFSCIKCLIGCDGVESNRSLYLKDNENK